MDGKSLWRFRHAVVIAEDAEMFTSAHEIGHTYFGRGHECSVAGDGWDVNHATLPGHLGPAKISVEREDRNSSFNFYSFMCTERGLWWITEEQYRLLLDDLTVGTP